MDICAPSSGPDGAPLGMLCDTCLAWLVFSGATASAQGLKPLPPLPLTHSPPLALECQILPPHVLILLQCGNRPGKAHVPFLQDVGAVTQRRGKFRILLAQQNR